MYTPRSLPSPHERRAGLTKAGARTHRLPCLSLWSARLLSPVPLGLCQPCTVCRCPCQHSGDHQFTAISPAVKPQIPSLSPSCSSGDSPSHPLGHQLGNHGYRKTKKKGWDWLALAQACGAGGKGAGTCWPSLSSPGSGLSAMS